MSPDLEHAKYTAKAPNSSNEETYSQPKWRTTNICVSDMIERALSVSAAHQITNDQMMTIAENITVGLIQYLMHFNGPQIHPKSPWISCGMQPSTFCGAGGRSDSDSSSSIEARVELRN